MNSEKDFDKTPGSKKTITENRKNREGNMKNQKKIPIKGTRNPRNLLVQINKILMIQNQPAIWKNTWKPWKVPNKFSMI